MYRNFLGTVRENNEESGMGGLRNSLGSQSLNLILSCVSAMWSSAKSLNISKVWSYSFQCIVYSNTSVVIGEIKGEWVTVTSEWHSRKKWIASKGEMPGNLQISPSIALQKKWNEKKNLTFWGCCLVLTLFFFFSVSVLLFFVFFCFSSCIEMYLGRSCDLVLCFLSFFYIFS